ncbi:MAG: group II intron reverse transcriptase/maturase [Microthrixaceae bacterium]
MNTGEPWPDLDEARVRVLGIQTKLHQWSTSDGDRRFDDLFNLVADPAFLTVAWDRVRGNRGARSAGVDGVVPRSIEFGDSMLRGLRAQLKARSFEPLPVKERMIPKASGKLRRLGIPAVRDRIVQASLKLVLEPIFEADFHPCSYGFRPRRRPHDAIAEIHMLATNEYSWVLEGDIEACFDEISHPALMGRIRERIGDKRVLGLIKAFLCAGVLSEDGVSRDTKMGTPQGGILSPLLANIALSALDDHFADAWQRDMATRSQRATRRNHGGATYRLVRYADDFVVMVAGTEAHAEGLRDEVATVLAPMGLRLSEHKTSTVHIDEGFEFLGFRIQRQRQQGSNRRYVYTWPSRKGSPDPCVGGVGVGGLCLLGGQAVERVRVTRTERDQSSWFLHRELWEVRARARHHCIQPSSPPRRGEGHQRDVRRCHDHRDRRAAPPAAPLPALRAHDQLALRHSAVPLGVAAPRPGRVASPAPGDAATVVVSDPRGRGRSGPVRSSRGAPDPRLR